MWQRCDTLPLDGEPDADLTLAQLADNLGCTVNQLAQVINSEYGTNFHNFVDKHRVEYARNLLLGESDDPNYEYGVANQAGFKSILTFYTAFRNS